VDEDLAQMGENINLVRADVDSINVSMKSVLECLEVLERQSTAKDKLVDNLNRCVTILSKALGQCSGGEDILKMLSGSGRREDPFELDDDDQASWDDYPEESSPEARATASPYPEHELSVRTTQQPTQIVLGLWALVLKGRTSDLGTWVREKGMGLKGECAWH